MNGVHDLGGMHGFGPVMPEANEPVFHHEWERRVFALALSLMGAGIANVDEFRHGIERMPPAHYLESSYYEHWLHTIETLLAEKGVLNEARRDPAEAEAAAADLWANPDAGDVPSIGVKLRRDPKFKARFKAGDRVTVRKLNPTGHTRAPRYTRGRRGMIYRDWGTFVFPDTHAHGGGADPQHCYAVEFSARELWGAGRPANERVYVDLWERYLERDGARTASPVTARLRSAVRPKKVRSKHAPTKKARSRKAR